MFARSARHHRSGILRRFPRSRWTALACLTGLACLATIAVLTAWAPEPPGRVSDTPVSPDRTTRTAVVATDILNLREAASADSAILASFSAGQRVTIVGERVNGFVPVAYGTGRGWMAEAYLTPAGANADGERWIEVDRGSVTVTLHEGNRVVATFTGSVGADRSDEGYYATAPGTYHVYSMTKDLTWTPFAEDGYLTDWVGFDPERNNGFHSPIRDASGAEKPVQSPTTKGCVRLDAGAAEEVFAFSYIGMRVEIHD